MDEHTLNKLAEMLRPILERNEYYANEKREKYREREREREKDNRGVTENFELSPVCVGKLIPAWFSPRFLWYSIHIVLN